MATYTLNPDTQSYNITELQNELTAALITASINGHGPHSFTVNNDPVDDIAVDAVVQAHINNGWILDDAKTTKIAALMAERLNRIQSRFPAISDDNALELITELWTSIIPGSRNPTANWQYGIDCYTAAKQAVVAINALLVVAEVEAYDVVNTPSWPI